MAYDAKTGDVKCSRCGILLGNINTGDYFKLISLKYCPKCRESADRERKRLWMHDKRVRDRQIRKAEIDNLNLLREENELLRERIKELEDKIEQRGLIK